MRPFDSVLRSHACMRDRALALIVIADLLCPRETDRQKTLLTFTAVDLYKITIVNLYIFEFYEYESRIPSKAYIALCYTLQESRHCVLGIRSSKVCPEKFTSRRILLVCILVVEKRIIKNYSRPLDTTVGN